MKPYLQIALLFGLFLSQGSIAQNGPKLTNPSASNSDCRSYYQRANQLAQAAEAEPDSRKKTDLLLQAAKTLEKAADLETTKEKQTELLFRAKAFCAAAKIVSDEEKQTDVCSTEQVDLEAIREELERAKKEAQAALETAQKMQKEAETKQKEAEKKLLDAEEQAKIAKTTLETAKKIQEDTEKKAKEIDATREQMLVQKTLEATQVELEVEKAIAKRNFRRAIQLVHANESLVDSKRLLDHIDQEQRDFDLLIIGALDRLRSRDFSRARRIPSGSLDADFFFGNMCERWALQERDFFTAWILLRRFLSSSCAVAWREPVIESGAEELAISGYALFLLNHYHDGIDDSAIPTVLKENVLDKLEEETRLMLDRFKSVKHQALDFCGSTERSNAITQIKQLLINLAALWLLANGEEIEDGLDLPGIEKAIKKALEKGKCRHPRKREHEIKPVVAESVVLKLPNLVNKTKKETENKPMDAAKPAVGSFSDVPALGFSFGS